ncbi:type VI secretion system baseplate subunit TssF [Tropicimonas sp. S265A]|uniref:type VI secretion system baseplate subunit TssF n=1 Tax=Tropicimonas sp. S265A TaxID=3415134 RepID=UPI003C7C978C
MDSRLLRHYETELRFIREMGGEFAQAYPKIAARLGMEGTEVLDPYVERLFEGFAFMSARVQLELDMQYPTFTSNLLEIVYPHFLAPTPSVAVVDLLPDASLAEVTDGFAVPRGTVLRSDTVEGTKTACTFCTAHDLTLWPIEIAEAEYVDSRAALVAAGLGRDATARAGIRLRLKRMGGGSLEELSADKLTVFLKGQDGGNWLLHELLSCRVEGVLARSADRRDDWKMQLDSASLEPRGYDPEDALLPCPSRSFDGYRLLQEYFAMPERFHFLDLVGLQPAFQRAQGAEVDIYLLLDDGHPDAPQHVSVDAFSFHATPVVNLFEKRCDRVLVTDSDFEHHVVVDKTASLDYEVVQVTKVAGISSQGAVENEFLPFYSRNRFSHLAEVNDCFYAVRRRARQRSEKDRLKGQRTSYLGSEVYLNLVDRDEAPYSADLTQLSVQALCTNRDLPLLLATGAPDVLHLQDGGPVRSVATPIVPTRPRPSLTSDSAAWRLISHLSLNYLSIADTGMGGGADALREIIGLYAPKDSRTFRRQLEGLVTVKSRPIVRQMPDEVLSTAVKGLEVVLEFDESAFEGTGVYTLASVLEKFLLKYSAINSFTECVLSTQQRGEVTRWDPIKGLRQVV